jgi:polysaccharide pyruvyl transferase WcaK-like protein
VHILVEPSDYVLRNSGDMAMQEVAITRAARLWPDATIFVLTNTPDQLPRYASGVRPLDAGGRRAWLTGPSSALSIRWVRGLWSERHTRRRARDFVQLVRSASLVLVSGMGGITDVFHDYATGVLLTLELAIRAGVPTAMMSQGLGPLRDTGLRHLAGSILPRVDLIALREARAGHQLLTELGVPESRIVATGDDAVEIAHWPGATPLGTALGVNLRCASYSEVDAELADRVREGVAESARRLAAVLVAVPISHVPGEEDALTIARLLGERVPDVSQVPPALPALLEQIRRCRVVVTGSYHAGVFALASGIPVVALARSAYYVDKFLGLADQFGGGCELVSLAEPDIAARLVAAIDGAWRGAEGVRPRLLEAAARQIQLGHAAYRRVCELVERRRQGRR